METAELRRDAQLREYLNTIAAHKWLIAITVTVCLAIAVLYTLRQAPSYYSEAEVLVRPGRQIVPTQAINMNTQVLLASSSEVAGIAEDDLEALDVEDPVSGLTAEAIRETEVLSFLYTDRDPDVPQRAAQAFADAYLKFRRDQARDELTAATEPLRDTISELQGTINDVEDKLKRASDVEISILQATLTSLHSQKSALEQQLFQLNQPQALEVGEVVREAGPPVPSRPPMARNLLLGLVVGVATGIALSFLRDRLDARPRSKEDVELETGAPVLASIPRVRGLKSDNSAMVTLHEPLSSAAEAYRALRTSVLFLASQRDARSIMVTSARAQEGKSVTAANLAVCLAEAGKMVILVSADLRKPTLHKLLNKPQSKGLTEALAKGPALSKYLRQTDVDKLWLLNTGALPPNPGELLGSERVGQLLDELKEIADFVIIDVGPVLPAADAMALAPLVDATLFVIDARKTTQDQIAEARRRLDQAGATVMGTVLNAGVPAKWSHYYQTYEVASPAPNGRSRYVRRTDDSALTDRRQ